MDVLEGLIRTVLGLTAVVGLLLCGFYALVAPHSHFPQAMMLSVSIGAAGLLGLYETFTRTRAR